MKINGRRPRFYAGASRFFFVCSVISKRLIIREIQLEDFSTLMELYTYLHEQDVPAMDDQKCQLWTQIVEDKDYHILVAEVEGKLVSSCTCVIIPNLTAKQRPYAFVATSHEMRAVFYLTSSSIPASRSPRGLDKRPGHRQNIGRITRGLLVTPLPLWYTVVASARTMPCQQHGKKEVLR